MNTRNKASTRLCPAVVTSYGVDLKFQVLLLQIIKNKHLILSIFLNSRLKRHNNFYKLFFWTSSSAKSKNMRGSGVLTTDIEKVDQFEH